MPACLSAVWHKWKSEGLLSIAKCLSDWLTVAARPCALSTDKTLIYTTICSSLLTLYYRHLSSQHHKLLPSPTVQACADSHASTQLWLYWRSQLLSQFVWSLVVGVGVPNFLVGLPPYTFYSIISFLASPHAYSQTSWSSAHQRLAAYGWQLKSP